MSDAQQKNSQRRIFKKQELHEMYAAENVYASGQGFRQGKTLVEDSPVGPIAKTLQENGFKSVNIIHSRVCAGGWVFDLETVSKLPGYAEGLAQDASASSDCEQQSIDWESCALAKIDGDNPSKEEGKDVWVVELEHADDGRIVRVVYRYNGGFLPSLY